MNNVVIKGLPIPEIPREDFKKTVKKIADKLKVALNEDDIRCVPVGKDEKKQLKVIFLDHAKKEEIMKAKRNISLKSNDCGFQNNADLYINHDMSYESQVLFKIVRDFKKNNNYKFAWYSSGKIFLRKDNDSRIIHMRSENTLNSLKN